MSASAERDWDCRVFYERQEAWSGAYTRPITDPDREKATLTERYCGHERRVLELGAGGGQAAAAAAQLGFSVDAVEIVPAFVAHAQTQRVGAGRLTVVEGDFYTVELAGTYGAVVYWDGFGIGSDADQQTLLGRIAEWLAEDGRALIDVYTPWYWRDAAGQEMRLGSARRRYDFHPSDQTMIDTWWPDGHPEEAVAQRLRCYAPDDLADLTRSAGLVIAEVIPGGVYDIELGVYRENVPLADAMSYTAVIGHTA